METKIKSQRIYPVYRSDGMSYYMPVCRYTVNSLMFAGINVCVFETKPCLRGLIFAVSLGLDSYLDT